MRGKYLATEVGVALLTGYLTVVAVLAAVIFPAEAARFSVVTVLAAALPGWLATFQVPLTLTGASFTALPLLPTVLMILLIAAASSRVARRSRMRHPKQAVWVILTMGLSHAVCGSGAALVVDGRYGPVAVAPAEAAMWCGAIAVAASTLGLLRQCGLLSALWERADGEIRRGLRVGLLAMVMVLGVGALVVATAVCLSLSRIQAVTGRIGSAGDVFGNTVLSVLYLPDAVLAGWSFAMGIGLSVGDLVFRPLWGNPGALPDVPLLAILPVHEPARWWAAVLVLPAAVGGLVGLLCRNVHENPYRRVRAVAVAAVVVAVSISVWAVMLGGRLGGGRLDPISTHPWMLIPATFCWIAVPAAATAWFAGPWRRSVLVPTESADSEITGPERSAIEPDGAEVNGTESTENDEDVHGAGDTDEDEDAAEDAAEDTGEGGTEAAESAGDIADGEDIAGDGDLPENAELILEQLDRELDEIDSMEFDTDEDRYW